MNLTDLWHSFARLTGDAIAIALRRPEDDAARLVWVNTAFEAMFGYPSAALIDQPVSHDHVTADQPDVLRQVAAHFDSGDTQFKSEARFVDAQGRDFWASVSCVGADSADGRYSVAILRNVTHLKAREQDAADALVEREAMLNDAADAKTRLMTAINAIPAPVAIFDQSGLLKVFNNAFDAMMMRPGEDAYIGMTLRDVMQNALDAGLFPSIQDNRQDWLEAFLAKVATERVDLINRFPDGKVLRAETHFAPNGDILVIGSDVTEIENSRSALQNAMEVARYQAMHDELTGLGNRRYLTQALDAMIDLQAHAGGEIQALNIDLDRFKHVNDTQGHALGDALLKCVAARLQATMGDRDVIARVGGDEFVILRYSGDTDAPVDDLAQAIVSTLSQPQDIDGKELRIGASVGIASTDVSDAADLIVNSDVALYRAKSSGRNRFAHFRQADKEAMERDKRLSDQILEGLERGQFVPAYQPQACAITGALVGLEALARWHHPTDGLQAPGLFLQLAEELNVVERIDEMIFDAALGEIPDVFTGRTCPSLSFNVSHRRLMSDGLVRDARRASDYPGRVSFELLESVFLDEEDAIAALQIDALKELGVGVEIDDFGSGHASIIALEHIAPDRLKIDRRLVAPITERARSLRMVRSIVEIGQALDIGITAEGVETEAQAALLTSLGCTRLQGYLIGRPTLCSDLPGKLGAFDAIAERLKAG